MPCRDYIACNSPFAWLILHGYLNLFSIRGSVTIFFLIFFGTPPCQMRWLTQRGARLNAKNTEYRVNKQNTVSGKIMCWPTLWKFRRGYIKVFYVFKDGKSHDTVPLFRGPSVVFSTFIIYIYFTESDSCWHTVRSFRRSEICIFRFLLAFKTCNPNIFAKTNYLQNC